MVAYNAACENKKVASYLAIEKIFKPSQKIMLAVIENINENRIITEVV
jgi:hypothetical protein